MLDRKIKEFKFDLIPSKAPFLNSLVEILVKQTKNLIFKSIGNKVLHFPDFDLLINRIIYLINSRPLTHKSTMSADPDVEVITSNMLLKGFNPHCMEIVPTLEQS